METTTTASRPATFERNVSEDQHSRIGHGCPAGCKCLVCLVEGLAGPGPTICSDEEDEDYGYASRAEDEEDDHDAAIDLAREEHDANARW